MDFTALQSVNDQQLTIILVCMSAWCKLPCNALQGVLTQSNCTSVYRSLLVTLRVTVKRRFLEHYIMHVTVDDKSKRPESWRE